MPLTKTQALFLSNDELLAGLLENAEIPIELSDTFPFFPINGDSLRVERSLPSDFGVDPQFDPVPLTVTEGLAAPPEVRFELKMMAQDVIVEDLVSINQSSVNSQKQLQLFKVCKRMLYKFWKTFIVGNNLLNPEEPDGLRRFATVAQTIQTVDTVNFYLDLNDLPRMLAMLRANDGRACAIVANDRGISEMYRAHFAKGVDPDVRENWEPRSTGFLNCPDRAIAAKGPRLHIDGVPVYRLDTIPKNETLASFSDATSIYAFICGRGGIYGIVPASSLKKMIHVREVLSSSVTNTIYRVLMPFGLVIDVDTAVVRLQLRGNPATA